MQTAWQIRPPFKQHHNKHKNDHDKHSSEEAESNKNIGEDLAHDMLQEGIQNKNLNELFGISTLENMSKLIYPGANHLLKFIFGCGGCHYTRERLNGTNSNPPVKQ